MLISDSHVAALVEKQRMNPLPLARIGYMLSVLGFFFGGGILAIMAGSQTHESFLNRLAARASKRREALQPHLYRCDNNGVMVLVTAEAYNAAVAVYQRKVDNGQIQRSGMLVLHVVPEVMLFCDDGHFYPCRLDEVRTGNYAALRSLTEGCRVEDRWDIFVPYSSSVMGNKEWQQKTFRVMKFEEARDKIAVIHDRLAWRAQSRRRENIGTVLIIATAIMLLAVVVLKIFR